MGSGCNQSNPGKNCPSVVSSNCVKYMGDPVPVLGICTGDTITEVEQTVINKLLTVLDGTGIDLSALTVDCQFLTSQLIGLDHNLANIVQVLIDSACTLKQLVDVISNEVFSPVSFNTLCLAVSGSNRDAVIQALINKTCAIDAQLAVITTQINDITNTTTGLTTTIETVTGNFIKEAITSCNGEYGMTKTGAGDAAVVSIDALCPPKAMMLCWDPSAAVHFDNTGKGNAGTPYCGWYVCNGKNGTPDMRGYAAAGATILPANINGGALDTIVDAASNSDSSLNTIVGAKNGLHAVGLTISQIPSHSHTATQAPHSHTISYYKRPTNGPDAQVMQNPNDTNVPANATINTSSVAPTITVSNTGGGTKHENRQPTFYGFWITRL